MKRIVTIVLALAITLSLALSVTGCKKNDTVKNLEGTYTGLEGTTLNVINWGEYISDGSEGSLDVVAAFEKATGITVNYQTLASCEDMYAKIKSNAVSVDVVVPSDYMIERMKNEGLLKKLDYSKITNYKYIDEQYKNLYYDENNEYTVPYNVGMVGVIYDTTKVQGTPDSWSLLWDEQYKGELLNFSNPRDGFMTAQELLGIDLNSTDKADWDKAAAKLMEETPILQGRVMDEIFNKMEGSNAVAGPYYAGDFLTMKDNNDNLGFYYPKEGTNVFVDAMCVPNNAQNFDAAMMFINFMLEPEVALANAEYICYATPNTAVLNNDEYSLKDNEYLYPKTAPKADYYHDLDPEVRSYYESLWEKIVK